MYTNDPGGSAWHLGPPTFLLPFFEVAARLGNTPKWLRWSKWNFTSIHSTAWQRIY
jgi:hypothetical protein